MKHYIHFTCWLLLKWANAIFAVPIRFNRFYRGLLYREPIFYTFITVFIAVLTFMATALVGLHTTAEHQLTVTDRTEFVLNCELAVFVGYYCFTMLSIQHYKYCQELEHTMSVLKGKE
jgi:hypothetical protein